MAGEGDLFTACSGRGVLHEGGRLGCKRRDVGAMIRGVAGLERISWRTAYVWG